MEKQCYDTRYCNSGQDFFQDIPRGGGGGGGQISNLKIIGGHHFFNLYVQVSLNFFVWHAAASISAYMDLLATRSVQVHTSIWPC